MSDFSLSYIPKTFNTSLGFRQRFFALKPLSKFLSPFYRPLKIAPLTWLYIGMQHLQPSYHPIHKVQSLSPTSLTWANRGQQSLDCNQV